ncbi:MAG: hypothetical protein Q7S08_01775 [bacterium]|nr:hypothetical protein [bacterium]
MIKVPRGKPREVLSELASLVLSRGKPRGIEPVLRLHSDEV